jgi:hypothetical protein
MEQETFGSGENIFLVNNFKFLIIKYRKEIKEIKSFSSKKVRLQHFIDRLILTLMT